MRILIKFVILLFIAIALFAFSGCSQKNEVPYLSKDEQQYIIQTATNDLDSLPLTVTASVCERSAGGTHDFYSEGDYWWPDPENPDGPYIRRDGQTNPDNFVAHRLAMIRLSRIVGMESSAYLLTGEEKFTKNDFVNWLTNSEYGQDEMNTKNNHATCWVMQVGAFARLTENEEVLTLCRERFKNVLLPNQMAENGSFPLELERTKPYGYSLFNLDAFMTAAEILSDESHNLYAYKTADGKNLELGAEFMYPYVKNKSKWPYEPDVMYWDEWPVRHPFLLFAGRAYNHPEYIELWKKLEGYPETQEVIRNLPIRNSLIWLLNEPVKN